MKHCMDFKETGCPKGIKDSCRKPEGLQVHVSKVVLTAFEQFPWGFRSVF